MSNTNIDPDDIGHNPSTNPSLSEIVDSSLSRRGILKGAAYASLLGMGLACGSNSNNNQSSTTSALALNFKAIPKSIADSLTVPEGYSAKVLFRTGDPISGGIEAYLNNGTDTDFANRSGDHHDGMQFYGKNGNAWEASQATRGLLVLNHEVAEDLGFMHVNGPTGITVEGDRPSGEIDKEVEAHGVSIIEVFADAGTYSIDLSSTFNRRVTGATIMDITGPVRGHELVKTFFSPAGTRTRGTINNCANGTTPWGTYLTCEENWAGYFYRNDTVRTAKEETSFSRYGLSKVTKGRYNWARPTASLNAPLSSPEDSYRRWNASATGASTTSDYRNVANTFGWVVEIDPFSPKSTPRKRTALGRMAHEGSWAAPAISGKSLVFYMGDDSRNEYAYKFVSTQKWDPADAKGGLSAGDKYLDAGILYVAKFNNDGSGEWLPLTISNSNIKDFSSYSFADAADVLINTRLAADAVKATKMDRPEWVAVHPVTKDVYLTLTNSVSSSNGRGAKTALDAANPRYYSDTKGTSTNKGNVNGHIIRWREKDSDHTATTFNWDIYLFGGESSATANINISGLESDNDFSSPDGLWFSQANPGLLWIQTDDGAYTDVTNCMMLAAVPGSVGDGAVTSITSTAVPSNNNADQTLSTPVGAKPTTSTLRRFLVGPRDCEITGIAESPDGKAIFVNIQHPGESSTSATTGLTSNWPDGGSARPRSATVVITRNDGGKVGL